MTNWRKALVRPDTPILEAMRIIDAAALQIAIVIDDNGTLLGTVTDGDIRRGILRGESLDSPVRAVMNVNPVVGQAGDKPEKWYALMKVRQLRHLPIVNRDRQLVNVELWDRFVASKKHKNWVVLMAGGLGTRLRPLTDDCPKPLLKIGTTPILEVILTNFILQGFSSFYISVNYMADKIMDYFGDGSKWGAEIRYLHETQRLGTAGALSLIRERHEEPLIVMNGDLLTKVNFQQLLDFHNEAKAEATMCVREYEYQVPYGVIRVDGHRLIMIEEKPLQRFFINGGIYVISPQAKEAIPYNTFYDMTTLFEQLIGDRVETAVFPIREYWMDIGRMDDFVRANEEFRNDYMAN